MDFLLRLKTETRPQHDSIESKLDLLREDLTFDEYVLLLERFYGFYLPVEELLSKQNFFDYYPSRLKTPYLEQDLRQLGREISTIARFSMEGIDFSSAEKVFGPVYVIEGSTLGSQVLSKHFARKFDLTAGKGLSFFTGKGQGTMLAWKEFQQRLIESLRKLNLRQDVIIRSAQDSFTALEQWITAPPP